MPIGLLGKKLGMSQMFDESGVLSPITLIQVGPCPIVQIKSENTDGYTAVQLGFEPKAERKANKPEMGHFQKAGVEPMRIVREFRVDDVQEFEVGASLDVSLFQVGDRVDVVGKSIGRGYQGPIKRHHARRGPESHGSMYHRRPGSMGQSSFPSRTFKGKKLAGQMGDRRSTIKNLEVLMVDAENNLLAIRGSVPGHKNGFVMIRKLAEPMKSPGKK